MNLRLINDWVLNNLKPVLEKAGYTEKAFFDANISVVSRYSPRYKFLLDKKLKDRRISYELISLFFFGDKIKTRSLEGIFMKSEIKKFVESGTLCHSGESIFSEFKIIPYQGYYFLSDFVTKYDGSNQKESDLVFPVSQDSADLVEASLKTKVKRTLDPTTGCGVHAIIQSKYSNYVLGVDINPRAIELARANASINNVKNVEFQVGDLYKPAKGVKFDRILSNPPYETSAHTKLVLGNGGEDGRDALDTLVSGLPDYLSNNGICQIVAKMFLKEKETIGSVMKRLLGKQGFKILYQDIYSSDIYQDTYARYDNVEDFNKYTERVTGLLDRYKKNGIARIRYGVVSLKKSKRHSFAEKKYSNFYTLPLKPSDVIKNYFG